MPVRIRKRVVIPLLPAIAFSLWASAQSISATTKNDPRLGRFRDEIEHYRRVLGIPGMAVIVLRNQHVIWKGPFGYVDPARKRPYTPDTPQHIASLTKTFAATLVLQRVENAKLDLNEPVADFVPDVQDRRVQIKHLLSHTSEGTPGDQYRYNGDRYDLLTQVLEKQTGKPFRQLIAETFIKPLEMEETAPGQDLLTVDQKAWMGLKAQEVEHYRQVLRQIAPPYALYGEESVPTTFPPQEIGAAAGMISTVNDLAKFDVAIDQHRFLRPETQALAWTPFVSNSGKTLPHGLGWFAETFAGEKLVWHYGHWPGMYSATYVKIPAKNLTMILLANNEAASAPFYLAGGIETSVFACAFLKEFAWKGDDHGCEASSSAAMQRWVADRRTEVRTPVRVSAQILKRYVGDYKLAETGTAISVTYRNGRLFINLPRKFTSELFPESATRFFLKTVDYEIIFVPGEQGAPIRLYVVTPGDRQEAQRIQ